MCQYIQFPLSGPLLCWICKLKTEDVMQRNVLSTSLPNKISFLFKCSIQTCQMLNVVLCINNFYINIDVMTKTTD